MPTHIYHITHVDNLPSIIKSDGLIANSRLRQQQTKYLDIAHGNIQDRRARKRVPCGVGGYLHDYVPFYFAPRSPMLYAIHKNNVDIYKGGQQPILHLVSNVETVDAAGLSFVGTDGHAVMEYTDFFDKLEELRVVDWEIMKATYWHDTPEDGDRKRRRQAEFLIHQFFPWTLIQTIGVINNKIETQVREILQNSSHQPSIKLYPE
ncbi:DUF4433 domain-containing protein [Scytonema sp. UIC 10036]|uniref:type II toxin-antitoxin system toxin DNA ADP-ribosyl transferase DarT n=1 Tax=Scytonema sp. UIC 10036 TaxID=2304196 RepID=UPI0012DAD98A|nr:DUF4433 domain-containing protein [Scytonema sp. UIC 10036]MUG92048.1 DUF4433 domain-containing protein [Scytonema sp. UIC 10036]